MQQRVPDSLKQCRDGKEQSISKTCVLHKSSSTCNYSFQALFVPYNAAFIDHWLYIIPVRYPASKRARMV